MSDSLICDRCGERHDYGDCHPHQDPARDGMYLTAEAEALARAEHHAEMEMWRETARIEDQAAADHHDMKDWRTDHADIYAD